MAGRSPLPQAEVEVMRDGFYEAWQRAMKEPSRFVPVFMPWWFHEPLHQHPSSSAWAWASAMELCPHDDAHETYVQTRRGAGWIERGRK